MTDADTNTADDNSRTPLSLAAERGDEADVKLFLERGDVDLNAKDSNGRTPLLLAVENFHKTVVELLLEKDGVDSNTPEKNGRTPLSWGAGSGYWEAVELLLKKEDIDLDSKDNNGRTPLSWAAGNGRWYGTKLLLDKGVNPNIADNNDSNGRTPLSWAAEERDGAAKKRDWEAEERPWEAKKIPWETEFWGWAAKESSRTIIELLLDRGADPKTIDNDGRTPLSWLVKRGHHKFVLEKDLIRPDFSLTDTHWAPEFATLLSNETWELILKHMPEELRWDLEYAEPYQSRPCWTLTPSSSLLLGSIPLTIAGAPVIIPVSYKYDMRPALSPPPDPRQELISPKIPLTQEVIHAILDTYDNPTGFYVLANGWLEIIVNEDFDFTFALSHRPQTFGGLRVSYIQQTIRPCVSRTSISPNVGTNQSSALTSPMLRIGGVIKAQIPGSKSSGVDFEGRIGVMTKCGDRLYLTVSTHMGTEAWLSMKKAATLDVSWKDDVKVYSACGTINNAHIAHTFDPEAGIFPNGFLHDTSLVEVPALPSLQDALRCPYPADWLSDTEWSKLKPGDSSKLHLLGNSEDDSKGTVKSIPFEESENMVMGQAIFNTHKKNTLMEKVRNSFKGSKASIIEPGLDDWKDYVARALLFRLAPGMSTASGTAICVLEKRDDGRKFAKVAGFTSFVQDNSYKPSLSMNDDSVRKRLGNGELSFYGAFCVPDALKEHSIV